MVEKFYTTNGKAATPLAIINKETYWFYQKTNEQQATGLILAGVALIGFVIAGLIDQNKKRGERKMKQEKKSMVLTKYAITNITCFYQWVGYSSLC